MKATHLPKFLFTSALILTAMCATSVFGQTRFEPSNQIQLLDSDGVAPDVGSFDELFNSIEKTEAPPLPQGALTLEGPANWQPTAPRQLNPQNYESMPSVLRADQAQLPADNPFLQLEDLPPTNAYPKQRIESQYAVPGTAPQISGSQSREFPQRVAPADLTPAIIAPPQTYDPNVAPSLTGPRPQIDQPVPYLDQPLPQRREIVPRVPVNPQYAQPATVWTRPTAPECPIERAARIRREAGYAGYVPYGGRGLDPEDLYRREASRRYDPRYDDRRYERDYYRSQTIRVPVPSSYALQRAMLQRALYGSGLNYRPGF